MNCACGSAQTYQKCCEPFITRKELPPTAEQLMRSRYTAFTIADIDYIRDTLAPESREDFDEAETEKWAKESKWKKLTIISTKKGKEDDEKGVVEFSAHFEQGGEDIQLHEVSKFRKDKNGQWLFVDGDAHTHKGDENIEHAHPPQQPVVRQGAKVGRNDPCTCGSGKKFKKCCGA